MEKRNVKIDVDTAKEWYNSNDNSLKTIALQAFTEKELKEEHWKDIKTFQDALNYLKNNHLCDALINEYKNSADDSYYEAVCMYKIVIAALTDNAKATLTNSDCYYPIVQFYKEGYERHYCEDTFIGKIVSNSVRYSVVCGIRHGRFYFVPNSSIIVLSPILVASKEIAEHISKYFIKLLFDVGAKGMNLDYSWVTCS